jgi:tetratricopeptide (TPR) repeat protein
VPDHLTHLGVSEPFYLEAFDSTYQVFALLIPTSEIGVIRSAGLRCSAHLYYAYRYGELIEHCQGWVKRNPNLEWNYHHSLGAAYVQMGRYKEAIAELQEALKSLTIYEHTATELVNAGRGR